MEALELKPLEKTPIVNHDYSSTDQNYNSRDKGINSDENEEGNHLNPQQVAYYRFCALLVAWLSVILLAILAGFSFVASKLTNSAAAFGFGFDCVLDIGTSAVVIWRFMGPVGSIYSKEKERMALLVLGVLFILACCSISIRSIMELVKAEIPEDNLWVLIVAFGSTIICFSLAIAKFAIAKKLNSKSIRSDGYSSLAGGVTGFTWVISSFIIQKNNDLWFIDDIIGICVALMLLYYGLCLLYQNLDRSQVCIK
ncbi:transmembrane protein 163a-like isoform X1 [Apostichopus japonicus]|uniref:transmembrane protein 163a-like isoform X1 n=1 Tax=Stichopus japonicus TaxID=307972 RepID=UPI003AB70BA0